MKFHTIRHPGANEVPAAYTARIRIDAPRVIVRGLEIGESYVVVREKDVREILALWRARSANNDSAVFHVCAEELEAELLDVRAELLDVVANRE